MDELTLNPAPLKIDGREFIVLSHEEYQALLERIEDLHDLWKLAESKAEDDGPPVPWDQVRHEILGSQASDEEVA